MQRDGLGQAGALHCRVEDEGQGGGRPRVLKGEK